LAADLADCQKKLDECQEKHTAYLEQINLTFDSTLQTYKEQIAATKDEI
jgi:hypothetical protein